VTVGVLAGSGGVPRRGAAGAVMTVVRHDQDAAVAAVTVADDAWSALLADLLGRVAAYFPRQETRQCCGQMVRGLLMELEDHNCAREAHRRWNAYAEMSPIRAAGTDFS
jgi:hypothetical protein